MGGIWAFDEDRGFISFMSSDPDWRVLSSFFSAFCRVSSTSCRNADVGATSGDSAAAALEELIGCCWLKDVDRVAAAEDFSFSIGLRSDLPLQLEEGCECLPVPDALLLDALSAIPGFSFVS